MENNEQNNQPINNVTENQVSAETNMTPNVTPVNPTVSEPVQPVESTPVVSVPENPIDEPKIEQPTVEPKNKKSNNPILIVIIILLLACIGYLVYDNYIKEKPAPSTNSGQKVDDKQETEQPKVDDKQETEQPKADNQTPNTSDEDNGVTTYEKNERFIYENLSTECTDEEIKIAVQKYEDLLSKTADEPFTFLGYIGYENAKEKIDPKPIKYKDIDGASATNISFDDFKSKMLNYTSESYLENNWINKYVANDNGKLVLLIVGKTGWQTTVDEIFKFKNEDNSKYYAVETINGAGYKTKTIKEYPITKINGKCIIGN